MVILSQASEMRKVQRLPDYRLERPAFNLMNDDIVHPSQKCEESDV